MTERRRVDETRLGPIDRGLYVLFSRHADRTAHDRDRQRYRGTGLSTGFDVYLARVYGLAWASAVVAAAFVFVTMVALPSGVVTAVLAFLREGLPVVNRLPRDPVGLPRIYVAVAFAGVVGAIVRWVGVKAGGLYLQRIAAVRRAEIERTLPGAVRYLHVLASGTSDQREMLRRVATQDAYGATADAFRAALNKASMTGSLDEGLSMVARDTPSRDLLAPFLLKFREHAGQGTDALEGYLRMEGRLLSQRQARMHERASGFLELIAELFVVLLIVPALGVLIVTVVSVLAPGLTKPVSTPLGPVRPRAVLFYGSVAFVLVIGAGAGALVASLRPTDHSAPSYRCPNDLKQIVGTATTNPASAAVVLAVPALVVTVGLWVLDYTLANVVLLGYAAYSIPVGLVAVRRVRRDDAKDREIRDFVHAVSGHVSLGRPFPEAVDRVAREVDLGALQSDVDDLAFNLKLTTGVDDEQNVRAAALDRFVERVGTPLASQTVGLVVGALDAGSNSGSVFETLETEVGRLYHQRKSLRSQMLVYVAVGWTTALLIVGIVVAINMSVLDGFSQLSALANVDTRLRIAPDAIQPARDRTRFYLITQATVLACGWFAGTASRGLYDALLHSGVLVLVTYIVFTGLGVA